MSLQTEKEQNMSCQDDLVLHRSIYSDKEDRWSLDLENVHLQGGSLDKSCSKSFRQPKYIIKMFIKMVFLTKIVYFKQKYYTPKKNDLDLLSHIA